MKNYFDFTLTGKKFLPVWLIFYVLVILPYAFYYKTLTGEAQTGTPNSMVGFIFLGVIIAAFLISFYILKVSIESVKYSDSQVNFDGKFGTYLGKILLGFFLSIITLTIYMAWFIRDINRFIVNSSSVDNSKFEFQGKGGRLFVILLLSIYVPLILLGVLMAKYLIAINESFIYSLIYQGVVMIIMIPYMYLVYDWMVNIKFKNYQIKWQTKFGASCIKILFEILLVIVTFGIYMPLGYLKLYKYFMDKTVAEGPDKALRFGYDIDMKGDFLFIWGQMLLTITTAGIYYPWAYSKVGKRILKKTYTETIDA